MMPAIKRIAEKSILLILFCPRHPRSSSSGLGAVFYGLSKNLGSKVLSNVTFKLRHSAMSKLPARK